MTCWGQSDVCGGVTIITRRREREREREIGGIGNVVCPYCHQTASHTFRFAYIISRLGNGYKKIEPKETSNIQSSLLKKYTYIKEFKK